MMNCRIENYRLNTVWRFTNFNSFSETALIVTYTSQCTAPRATTLSFHVTDIMLLTLSAWGLWGIKNVTIVRVSSSSSVTVFIFFCWSGFILNSLRELHLPSHATFQPRFHIKARFCYECRCRFQMLQHSSKRSAQAQQSAESLQDWCFCPNPSFFYIPLFVSKCSAEVFVA